MLRHAILTVAFTATLGGRLIAQTPTSPAPAAHPLFTAADGALAAGFAVGTAAARPLDRRLARALRDPSAQANRFFSGTATTVREITEPGAFIIGGTLYAVGRAAHNARAAALGWHGTEAVIIAGLTASVIKGAFGRARPYADTAFNPNDFSFGRGFAAGNEYQSFPSGHTTTAFAAAAAVTAETASWWRNSAWYIGPAMYGGATLVGLSRMYNNMHWASDVVLGAAIGTFAGNKVVRYSHQHPRNRLDRWVLSASWVPGCGSGTLLSWSLVPR